MDLDTKQKCHKLREAGNACNLVNHAEAIAKATHVRGSPNTMKWLVIHSVSPHVSQDANSALSTIARIVRLRESDVEK